MTDGPGPAAAPVPEAGHRCACGFEAASLALLEDHLFTFPEDDHYELAAGAPFPPAPGYPAGHGSAA